MSAGSCLHTHLRQAVTPLSPPRATHHLHGSSGGGLGAGNGIFSAKGHFFLPTAILNQATPCDFSIAAVGASLQLSANLVGLRLCIKLGIRKT